MKMFFTLCCLMFFAACSLEDSEVVQEGSQAVESKSFVPLESTHCVVQVAAISIGQDIKKAPASPEGKLQCFPSFSQAIDFAMEGRVKLPEGTTPEDVSEDELNNTATATSFVIGIEYEHASYGGYTLTYTSDVTCYGYYLYVSSLPWGWDNFISSARAFSYCNHSYHYENPNFSGAMVDCGTDCSYVGDAMNDNTSSLRWTW